MLNQGPDVLGRGGGGGGGRGGGGDADWLRYAYTYIYSQETRGVVVVYGNLCQHGDYIYDLVNPIPFVVPKMERAHGMLKNQPKYYAIQQYICEELGMDTCAYFKEYTAQSWQLHAR